MPTSNPSTNFIPTQSDYECRYPLSDNAELIITTYDASSRSSPVEITILGLSRDKINLLCQALVAGDNYDLLSSITGDEDDIATALAIAEGDLSTPRPKYAPTSSMYSGNNGSKGSKSKGNSNMSNNDGTRTRRTRTSISPDDLSDAIEILRAIEPQGIAKSEILNMTDIDERLWIPAMKQLIEDGTWRVEGVKRGARYYQNA